MLIEAFEHSIFCCSPKTKSALSRSRRDSLTHIDRLCKFVLAITFRDWAVRMEIACVIDCIDPSAVESSSRGQWPHSSIEKSACNAVTEVAFVKGIERNVGHVEMLLGERPRGRAMNQQD